MLEPSIAFLIRFCTLYTTYERNDASRQTTTHFELYSLRGVRAGNENGTLTAGGIDINPQGVIFDSHQITTFEDIGVLTTQVQLIARLY